MPVPSLITDLSSTLSLNSPQGSESAKGTVDDYLRAHAGFIKQINDALLGPSVTLPSASTVSIGFASSINITITGSVTITAFDTIAEGALRYITFTGAPTITHNPVSMSLPGGQNIAAASADAAIFKSLGGGNWKCLFYMKASGTGPVAASVSTDGYLKAADFTAFAGKQSALGFTPYNSTNPSNYIPAATAASTYLPFTGGTLTGPLRLPDGSQGAPSLSFSGAGDSDTGLFHIADGIIGIVCNNVLVGRFTPSGLEVIRITQTAP